MHCYRVVGVVAYLIILQTKHVAPATTEMDVSCSGGKWGRNCTNDCNCRLSNEVCNYVNGICKSGCPDGKQLPNCTQDCDRGRYGRNCSMTCYCNQKDDCLRIAGTCLPICSNGSNCETTVFHPRGSLTGTLTTVLISLAGIIGAAFIGFAIFGCRKCTKNRNQPVERPELLLKEARRADVAARSKGPPPVNTVVPGLTPGGQLGKMSRQELRRGSKAMQLLGAAKTLIGTRSEIETQPPRQLNNISTSRSLSNERELIPPQNSLQNTSGDFIQLDSILEPNEHSKSSKTGKNRTKKGRETKNKNGASREEIHEHRKEEKRHKRERTKHRTAV